MAAQAPAAPLQRVVGRQIAEMAADELLALRAGSRRAVVDLGTGDGKRACRLAQEHPEWLIFGVDANPSGLRDASRKAARQPMRGGTPNIVYVHAPADRLPTALSPVDEVHIFMPWGSLMRGVLLPDPSLVGAVTAVCLPGASFRATVNLRAWHPPVPEIAGIEEPVPDRVTSELSGRLEPCGWHVGGAEILDDEGLAALDTSWTRRLRSSAQPLQVVSFWGTVGPGPAVPSPAALGR